MRKGPVALQVAATAAARRDAPAEVQLTVDSDQGVIKRDLDGPWVCSATLTHCSGWCQTLFVRFSHHGLDTPTGATIKGPSHRAAL